MLVLPCISRIVLWTLFRLGFPSYVLKYILDYALTSSQLALSALTRIKPYDIDNYD